MNFMLIFFGLLFYLHFQINQCYSKTMTYVNLERPVVDWLDERYFKNFSVVSRRVGRQDPRHYVNLNLVTLRAIDRSVLVDSYVYKYVANRYQPSFFETHFKFCDYIKHEPLFGVPLGKALGRDCPIPPGEFHLNHMSVSYVPKDFPLNKGRIYFNVSLTSNGVKEVAIAIRIDMEIKVSVIKKN